MGTKSSRFDLDWWVIQKRFIYIVAISVAVSLIAGGIGVYLWMNGNPFKNVGRDAALIAGARFDSFEGDVRVVRAETRETIQVRSDTYLLPGDIVQTQADGRARISLVDGSTMLLLPNSTITIRDNTRADDGQKTNVRVAVDRGKINLRTEQQEAGTTNVVETPLTQNKLTSRTAASFGVRDDKSEDIRVGEGSIETSTRSGETTTVRGGEYVAINQTGSIKTRERLLDVPMPSAPVNLEKIQTRKNGAASNVSLRWQRPASGAPAHYRVEVATSPFFVSTGKVIERDQLNATEFSIGDLRPGNYYWRVQAVAASSQASEWCDPQKFIVVAETGTGEVVTVTNVVIEYVAGSLYVVRGRTQPGNNVRIAGREALASTDGSFQIQLTAQKNQRDINVEAEDTHGNRNSYRFPLTPGATQRQ